MKLSIQGTNQGMISELYTRYSFSSGAKYEEGRHNICIEDGEKYGVFKGVANVELVCENEIIIHILPEEDEDMQIIYEALKNPPMYLSLGRYEDLIDIKSVDIVNIREEDEADTKHNIYIPVSYINGKKVAEGEFSNIKANPIEQVVHFPITKGNQIRLVATRIVDNKKQAGIGEFSVITEKLKNI